MPVFDTRSYFPDDTKFGKTTYVRMSVEPSGRYQAEFHWKYFDTEVRVRTKGQATSVVDAVTMAFHTHQLDRMDSVLIHLCPNFPDSYWTSIKRLVPRRPVNA